MPFPYPRATRWPKARSDPPATTGRPVVKAPADGEIGDEHRYDVAPIGLPHNPRDGNHSELMSLGWSPASDR